MQKPHIVYEYSSLLYINITNRCPNLCSFCIKTKWSMRYRGYNLALNKEPSASEVIKAINLEFARKKYPEIVFCGYGEPLMRWDCVRDVVSSIRGKKLSNVSSDIRIRIDTNGLGNLVNKRDITPEMKGLINSVSVSLNTVDKEKWYEIMNPFDEYKEGAFESVIDFIKKAKHNVEEVVVTAVDLKGVDTDAVKRFAFEVGVRFRMRPYLDEYEKT
ncbi:MAG: TatD family nuclease-associated radical SAM protein [Elusimicrobiales bacterium]